MYLKQLKLAGFKSFLDPVTISLQNTLVAIVGPNGCGKSNIIDAVRWVMGESSAKNLRGVSMSDVIFGGSSQRKALGQASVELIFDNSMGKLTGQYGSYQEISVKRLVTREGESFYYLNGVRCRRRDITDIFLGTGAGTKGYSIISQGTISRLVEARPEELRAYLDEAAGTSKYKERRRETLQGIAATKENLLRVSDIRDELDKQVQRLENQAKTANRYQRLCEEERCLKAEICVLKSQGFATEAGNITKAIALSNLSLEQHQAHATHAYQIQTEVNLQCNEANEALQTLQTNFYQYSTDIARLEEHLLQNQREKQGILLLQEQLQADYYQIKQTLEDDTGALQDNREELALLAIQIDTQKQQWTEKTQHLEVLQAEEQQSQHRVNALQAQVNETQNIALLAETHVAHHHQRAEEIKARLEKISQEHRQLVENKSQPESVNQQALIVSLESKVTQGNEALLVATKQVQGLTETLARQDKCLQGHKERVYQLTTEIAVLDAWIAQVLGRGAGAVGVLWPGWEDKTRWAEVIHVESSWVAVCELIFSEVLQGVLVEDLTACTEALRLTPQIQGIFVSAKKQVQKKHKFPLLSDKIQGVNPNYVLDLDKIYAANNLEEALVWLPSLQSEESIVTQEGHWLGPGWLRVFNLQGKQEGSVLIRQEKRAQIQVDLQQTELLLEQATKERLASSQELAALNQEIPGLQQVLSKTRDELRQHLSDLAVKEQAEKEASVRRGVLLDEQTTLKLRLEESTRILALKEIEGAQAKIENERFKQELAILNEERAVFQAKLKPYQHDLLQTQASLHEYELKRERVQLTVSQLEVSLERDEARLLMLAERLETNKTRIIQLEAPDEASDELLAEKLRISQELAFCLDEKKEYIKTLQCELNSQTQRIKEEETKALVLKEKIQQAEIEEQVLSTKASSILEGLSDLGYTRDEIVQSMARDATLVSHEQELLSLVEKIKRLGAINLAAIEEYESECERKRLLDQQSQDLTDALELLEKAITTLDKEMQQQFQTLFTELNNRFQILFPRLFGGGHAFLELTCDNLLEAGVVVMANPPGKRNSSIHLLSGGEKAMTAVALIFAIFQLNPSPFCMLDEVDAPLDEVNVGRFCELMKEMSGVVQFLFITHNKVTLLIAEQLIGVTMREPGVSRIVGVDVEQALLMSDT